MTLLLDTHVFLWLLAADPRLPAATVTVVADPAHRLVLSIASIWEMAIKSGLGKLDVPGPLEPFIRDATRDVGIQLLPIELHHVAEAQRLPHHHRDRFDRMLVAQARAERISLVTADTWIRAYDVDITW